MNQNPLVQRANSFAPGSPALAGRAFSTSEMGPREILSTIFKRKSMILVSFVLLTALFCASAIFYMKFIYKPVYEAKSLLLIRHGWENQDIELTPNGRQASVSTSELLATEARILQSRESAEKIISTMPGVISPGLAQGISTGLPVSASAVDRLLANFSVKSSGGNMLEASFKGPNPAADARIVNEMVNYYIDKRGDTYRNPKVILFLEQKTEEYRKKRAETESKLKAFQDQSQIISFDEHRSFLLNKQRQILDARRENETAIAQIQVKNSELERQLPNIQKTSIVTAEKMTDMDGRLFTLELQERELLSKYKEDNRLVTNIREQIKMTKDYISTHGPGSKLAPVDPAYQDLQKRISENKADLSALKIKQEGLDEQVKGVATEIAAFESQESKYKQLFRDATDNEDKYKTYLAKLEEARIHDELDREKMSSVSIIEPASIPTKPNNVPRPLILFISMAFFLGIAGSIGLAFILEITSPGMSTPAQAEKRMELPVLAVIANK
jgi:uncharacterized protein involved in exopolysaccharide biosynthesis